MAPFTMAISDKTGCEVRIDGVWQLVPLIEVHAGYRSAEKRCPECHGRVRTQGIYSGQQGVVMTHQRVHDGCPRMPKHYAGSPRRHPEILD